MKKLLTILFVFAFFSFCFVNAQENDDWSDDDPLSQLFDQDSMQEQNSFDALDILQEDSEQYVQNNEEIAKQEKKKEKEKKMKNKEFFSYISLGVDAPFPIYVNSLINKFDIPIPLGISLQYASCYNGIMTYKLNYNFDFIQYSKSSKDNFSGFLSCSLGFSPVHNDYCLVGIYGTLGIDSIEKYSYTSFGGSGLLIFNVFKKLGIVFNIDATCRAVEDYSGKEELAPQPPRYKNTWRIAPSIGFSYQIL